MTIQTASEYAAAYKAAFKTGGLTQGNWHSEKDSRGVACALGVIGADVNSPAKCPAQIMPRWLAQMVPAFFDKQKETDAFAWGLEFTAQLARLDGVVPFSVVHDWHANTVCQMGIYAAEKRGRDIAPYKALQALHLRALAGEKIGADEWRPVLKNAYANASADANADAYTNASANASADAWKKLADGMTAALSRVGLRGGE